MKINKFASALALILVAGFTTFVAPQVHADQTCAVFTGQNTPANTSDAIIVDIAPVDVTIQSTDSLPTFNCFTTATPQGVVSAPICSAYDGSNLLAGTPAPGTYDIKCQGGIFVSGYNPLIRLGKLMVVQAAAPTPSPTATSAALDSEREFAVTSDQGLSTSVFLKLPTILDRSDIVINFVNDDYTHFNDTQLLFRPDIILNRKPIDKFADPVQIRTITPGGDLIPVSSIDGNNWTALKLLPNAGNTKDFVNGYLINANGETVFLMHRAGYFGFKYKQGDLTLSAASNSSFTVGSYFDLTLSGGTGNGSVTYSTTTPRICNVSTEGTVKASVAGTCKIKAVKQGDNNYLPATTDLVEFTIVAPKATPTPTKSPSPSPKASPKASGKPTPKPKKTLKPLPNTTTKPVPGTTPANASTVKDYVILVDSRLTVASKKISVPLKSSRISVTLGQTVQLAIALSDPTQSALLTLVLPIGQSTTINPAQVQDANSGSLVTQSLQFLQKGTYRLIIREGGSTQVSIVSIVVK